MIKAFCITCVFFPTIAVADIWQSFESRCLTPLERIVPPDVGGLQLVSAADGRRRFDVQGGTLFVSGNAPDEPTLCMVVSRSEEPAEIANQFLAWSVLPRNMDRYAEIDLGDGALTLRSVEWREPQLELSLLVLEDSVKLSARDTDLES